jgi:hypothetical protein
MALALLLATYAAPSQRYLWPLVLITFYLSVALFCSGLVAVLWHLGKPLQGYFEHVQSRESTSGLGWRGWAKWSFCAITHPIAFLCFLMLAGVPPGSTLNLRLSTLGYSSNPLVYVPFALVVYSLWSGFQWSLMHVVHGYSMLEFFTRRFTFLYIWLCAVDAALMMLLLLLGMGLSRDMGLLRGVLELPMFVYFFILCPITLLVDLSILFNPRHV